MELICELCKSRHHPRQAHRFETVVEEVAAPVAIEEAAMDVKVSFRTANRRSREAYNAYQRKYMKAYRVRKRAGK